MITDTCNVENASHIEVTQDSWRSDTIFGRNSYPPFTYHCCLQFPITGPDIAIRAIRRLGENCPIFWKAAKNCQIIYIKPKFEIPKHLHQTSFETLSYLQNPCFETAYLGENVKHLLKLKGPQMSPFLWVPCLFKKINTELPKVANWQKFAQSGHPDYYAIFLCPNFYHCDYCDGC